MGSLQSCSVSSDRYQRSKKSADCAQCLKTVDFLGTCIAMLAACTQDTIYMLIVATGFQV
jgi:ribosomal protein L28